MRSDLQGYMTSTVPLGFRRTWLISIYSNDFCSQYSGYLAPYGRTTYHAHTGKTIFVVLRSGTALNEVLRPPQYDLSSPEQRDARFTKGKR